MRYSKEEYIFWSSYHLLCKEFYVRILSGLNYHGASLRGEVGSQNPDGLKIHLAIPSLPERKKHESAMTKFTVVPGFISESLEILKSSNVQTVNLCFDEKSVAMGTIVKTCSSSGDYNFNSIGDADYYFSSINNHKESLMNNLNYFYNLDLNDNICSAYSYLSSLQSKLNHIKGDLQDSVNE